MNAILRLSLSLIFADAADNQLCADLTCGDADLRKRGFRTLYPANPPPIVFEPGSSTTTLPPGPVFLRSSSEHQLMRLIGTTHGSNLTVLAGRSYGGHSWESAPPGLIHFTCDGTSKICKVELPPDNIARYQVEVGHFNRSPDNRTLASRFLLRATFGPTRRGIDSFLDDHHGDAQAWVHQQMHDIPPTSHREFYRQRVNPRVPEGSHLRSGEVRPACTDSSRWNRFAFTGEDVNAVLEMTHAGPDAVALSTTGDPRTVISTRVLKEAVYNPPESSRTYSSVHANDLPGSGYARSMLDSNDAWLALRGSYAEGFPNEEWMQMDLGAEFLVNGVVTQGRKLVPHYYAANFTVLVSTDGTTFNQVPGIFVNAWGTTVNAFPAGYLARHVRLTVATWKNWIALRVAVVLDGSTWHTTTPMLAPFNICHVDEWVGGTVSIGRDCLITFKNPTIQFTSGHAPPADRMVAEITSVAAVTNLTWRANGSRDDAVLLSKGNVAWSCDSATPRTGPLFATVQATGEMFVYDRRLAIVENTLEHPADRSSLFTTDGECVTVEKTFLNANTCVAGRETCAVRRYTSATFLLNKSMVRQFFVRGGKYVYHITGLRLASDAPSPCTGTSRWVRRGIEGAPCEATVNEATEAIIVSALEYGSTFDNEQIRDLDIDGGTECVAPAGAVVRLGNACWQHAHDYENNV